jgi:hypothetical protein
VPVIVTLSFALLPSLIAAQALIRPMVRISVESVVEEIGVIRIEGATIRGSIVASDRDTVTVRGAGLEAITYPRPGRKVVGVLEAVTRDVVRVIRADGAKIVIPRLAIAKVEQPAGRRSRAVDAGLGFLIGAGGGGAVGYILGANCHPTGFLGCFLEPQASTGAGVVIGGGAGAVIGALVSPPERWIAVPGGWLDSRVLP